VVGTLFATGNEPHCFTCVISGRAFLCGNGKIRSMTADFTGLCFPPIAAHLHNNDNQLLLLDDIAPLLPGPALGIEPTDVACRQGYTRRRVLGEHSPFDFQLAFSARHVGFCAWNSWILSHNGSPSTQVHPPCSDTKQVPGSFKVHVHLRSHVGQIELVCLPSSQDIDGLARGSCDSVGLARKVNSFFQFCHRAHHRECSFSSGLVGSAMRDLYALKTTTSRATHVR